MQHKIDHDADVVLCSSGHKRPKVVGRAKAVSRTHVACGLIEPPPPLQMDAVALHRADLHVAEPKSRKVGHGRAHDRKRHVKALHNRFLLHFFFCAETNPLHNCQIKSLGG